MHIPSKTEKLSHYHVIYKYSQEKEDKDSYTFSLKDLWKDIIINPQLPVILFWFTEKF